VTKIHHTQVTVLVFSADSTHSESSLESKKRTQPMLASWHGLLDVAHC